MRYIAGYCAVVMTTLWTALALAANPNEKLSCTAALNADQESLIANCTKQLGGKGLSSEKRSYLLSSRCAAVGRSNEFARAVEDCSEAIRLNPKNGEAFHFRAFALRMTGELDRALSDYSEAIRLKPQWRAEALSSRGRAWYEKDDLDRAMADLDAAARITANNWSLHYVRALVWSRRGDFDRAIESASAAIRVDPENSQGFSVRGESWRMKGDLDRALADQDKALELTGNGPRMSVSFVRRADTRRYRGEFDRALIDYDRALRADPGYVPAFVGRGLTYEKMGDLIRARIEFQEALASPHPIKTGVPRSARETALARLAAFESGAAQPVIPAVPARASSANSIPTPNAVVLAPASNATKQGGRIALVIGNSAYSHVPALLNPRRDADAIADSLRAIGFERVTLVGDTTREKLVDALRAFAEMASRADWAMVYYAGHGLEVNGVNFLIPVDAKITADSDVQREAVRLDEVLTAVEGARKLRLVLLDACRDNPLAAEMRLAAAAPPPIAAGRIDGRTATTRSMRRGLGEVKVSGATLVVYSAKHGQTALDGEGGNSPFAVAVAQRLATPNVEINKLFRLVRDDVMEATAGRQEPYTYGSLPGNADFYFVVK